MWIYVRPPVLFTFSVWGQYRLTLINCGSYQQEKMPRPWSGSNVGDRSKRQEVRGRQYPWVVAEGTCRISMTHMSLSRGLYYFESRTGVFQCMWNSAWACWMICFSGQMSTWGVLEKGRATRWKVSIEKYCHPPLFIIGPQMTCRCGFTSPTFLSLQSSPPWKLCSFGIMWWASECVYFPQLFTCHSFFSLFFLSVCSFPWLTEGILVNKTIFHLYALR